MRKTDQTNGRCIPWTAVVSCTNQNTNNVSNEWGDERQQEQEVEEEEENSGISTKITFTAVFLLIDA